MRLPLLGRRTLLFALATCSLSVAAQNPADTVSNTADKIVPLEVIVNGSKTGTWLLVEHAGALHAPRDAFEEWRVRLDSNAKSINFKGQDYWPLSAVPGYRSSVNFAEQSLDLAFSAQAFAETHLGLRLSTELSIDPAVPSVFVNYDVNYQRTEVRGGASIENLGMLTEVGFSSDLGVLTTSAVGQNLTHSSLTGAQAGFLRLETTLTSHRPDQKQTLRIGDTSTRAGMLGSSVYFGGIRFGTNFALTPGFITQPIPVLTGSSSAPSTVNLYVNDVLRQTSNVPTGPFAIDNFPALTGGGEARLVVRDLLGRETVITQPFFTSNRLLAAGLDDWSIEAGSVRRNLGSASNSYGPGFTRGFWRHGLNDMMTVGGVVEVGVKQQNLELGLTSSTFGQWLGSAGLAASNKAEIGTGQQWLLGLERAGLRTGVYFQAQGATENYRQLGQEATIKPIKFQLAGNWSYTSTTLGQFGAGFASIAPYHEARINTMSVNYSMRVGDLGSLSLTASRSQGAFSGSSLGLSLVLPLPGNGPVISGSVNRSGKETDFYTAASQSPTLESDLGWRVLAGEQQNKAHAEGGLQYFGRYGNMSGDVSTSTDQTTLRVSGNSGLVLTEGHLFATRRATESYALVEVAGYGNVGVGLGNNVLGRTDADGIALIPNLVPYQRNSVRLNVQDLPISAEIDSIEQGIVPGWRSVVKVKFPVRSGRGALVKVQFDDGDVAPAGAVVNIEGDGEEFFVARRGEAFVTGLQARNRLVLKWKERECRFEVLLPPETPDEIPRVGPLPCKGVPR